MSDMIIATAIPAFFSSVNPLYKSTNFNHLFPVLEIF